MSETATVNVLGELETDIQTLTLSDRCDACGPTSQAYVKVMLKGGPLMFCNHHYNKYEAGLTTQGAVVVADSRSDLKPKTREDSVYNIG